MTAVHDLRRFPVGLLSFVVFICATLAISLGWQAYEGREQALDVAETSMMNLSRSLVQQAEDTFEIADQMTLQVQDLLENDEWTPAFFKKLHRFMANDTASSSRVGILAVFGPDGTTLVSSQDMASPPINVRDRGYFQYHQAISDGSIYIGTPVLGRSSGQWSVTLSRRVNTPDGDFAGVVLATVPMNYFTHLYRSFEIGQKGLISLFNLDGTYLSRSLPGVVLIGHNRSGDTLFQDNIYKKPAGSMRYVSPIDGVERVGGFRRGDRYPVVVQAAMATEEILARWKSDFRTQIAWIVTFTLALCAFGLRMVWQVKRRQDMEASLARLSFIDALTGLSNRRAFNEHFHEQAEKASRHCERLSLILLDVDRFKDYNDAFGHQQGDECLKAIARALETAVDASQGLVARYGGEEFAVIPVNGSAEQTSALAEAIRQAVEALALPHASHLPTATVTVSLGWASLHPRRHHETSGIEKLIAMADEALYDAKRAGRNKVVGSATIVGPRSVAA